MPSMTLLRVSDMPRLIGVQVPLDTYVVLTAPAPLVGMSFPNPGRWEALTKLGVKHVVCLTDAVAPYDPTPLRVSASCCLTDLFGEQYPADPEAEEATIRVLSANVSNLLSACEGVVVHCVGGTGRTGTVIGCTLIQLGYSADEVVGYLDMLTRKRRGRGWPESPWQEDVIRRLAQRGNI